MDRSVSKSYRTFVWLGIFGIAMGFLEAIVVVYLRQLYFPEGFDFPLNPVPPQILAVEWLREITTIVMLVSLGMIAGKNFLQRFSYFLYSFAVWDIFYYVALKLLLDWPPSLLTWDLLFLIPVAWVGPVLAPVICSLTMALFAGIIVGLQHRGYPVRIKLVEWGLMLAGTFIIFCMFIWDYSRMIIQGGFLSDFLGLASNERFLQMTSHYLPTYFNWYLFAFGIILVLSSLLLIFLRTKSTKSLYQDAELFDE
jgi:hypothetical protein